MPFIYDDRFYEATVTGSYNSALTILSCVIPELRPDSIIDVGCGRGSWLSAAKELGVRMVLGLDGAYVDTTKLLIEEAEFTVVDLEQDFSSEIAQRTGRFDMAMSLEVAEHLPFSQSAIFVERLTNLSDTILFSAAVPFQGGVNHINEQWPEFWAILFREKGYACYDPYRRLFWEHPNVEWWYSQNMFLFVKVGSAAEASAPAWALANGKPLALVHPGCLIDAVSNSTESINANVKNFMDCASAWRG